MAVKRTVDFIGAKHRITEWRALVIATVGAKCSQIKKDSGCDFWRFTAMMGERSCLQLSSNDETLV
jgi:hypothetical protein